MNVNKYVYLLLCVFIFSCGQGKKTQSNETGDTDTVSTDTVLKNPGAVIQNTSSVPGIKQAFAITDNKLKRGLLDSVSYKYDCSGERNGTVTYYSDNGKLALIEHLYNEYSHFSAIDQYFVNEGNLYFTYLDRSVWSFESGQAVEGTTKEEIIEQRLYINNEQPLLCMEKKYTTRPQSTDNPNPESLESKEVKCKGLEPVLKDFSNLLAFKSASSHDCLQK